MMMTMMMIIIIIIIIFLHGLGRLTCSGVNAFPYNDIIKYFSSMSVKLAGMSVVGSDRATNTVHRT